LWNRTRTRNLLQNRCSSNRASTQKKRSSISRRILCYFICAFNLAIPRNPPKPYRPRS
jgi:hypothetical protein